MSKEQLPTGWRKVKVEDISLRDKGSIVSGPFGSNIGKRFFVGKGIPVIRGNNLREGDKKFIDEGFVYVTEAKAYELRNCEARSGDVVFTAAGTLGQVGIIPPNAKYAKYIISNKQLRLRIDVSVAEPDYVYYWFASPTMRRYVANQNTGASVPLITLGILRKLPVKLPPLPVQRKISAVLSAYDDLIENNLRRIAILEEMARLIYREWFVKFRFPGHEGVVMTDSPLGPIPVGWEVRKATDALLVDPRTVASKDDEKPFVPMSALSDNSMVISNVEHRSGSSGSKFKNGDTLFARITPCLENGKTGFVQFMASDDEIACGSTEFIVLRSRTLCPEYVYVMARSDDFRDNAIKSMTGASGRQRVQKSCFDKSLFPHPDHHILRMFSGEVSPMFRAIQLHCEKNDCLRRTRDLLLPRLISGELDVSELDIDVGGPAA